VNKHRGGLFSVALSRNHFRWELPSVLPFGARTFLPGINTAAMIRPTPENKPFYKKGISPRI